MGGVFKREYIWWNIRKDWMPLRKRQRIAQDAGGYIKHSDPKHWIQLDSTNNPTGNKNGNKRRNTGIQSLAMHGFSDSSSSDRLTEEQENEIAENIYDWWISGKSYKQWYAEKFQQLKLDFGEF